MKMKLELGLSRRFLVGRLFAFIQKRRALFAKAVADKVDIPWVPDEKESTFVEQVILHSVDSLKAILVDGSTTHEVFVSRRGLVVNAVDFAIDRLDDFLTEFDVPFLPDSIEKVAEEALIEALELVKTEWVEESPLLR